MATKTKFKRPVANKAASLVFFYYGDSKFETLGQETLKLKKAMQDYKFKVLLKHESLPSWADLSEKDEKLANIKDLPTKKNFFKYLKKLTRDGYYIDLYIFSHGLTGEFLASKGRHGSDDPVTAEDIARELAPSKTGFSKIPIRIIWGTNCYGRSLSGTWRKVGAKTTAGARYVNFYPNSYKNFIKDWNRGNIAFNSAVHSADTKGIRTLSQAYISTIDAPQQKKSGRWDGCKFGKTVLGRNDCAKDYFTNVWLDKGEWQKNKSGKENMNYSSHMFCSGSRGLTKNTRPRW